MKINSIIRQSLMIALLIYSTVSIAHPGGHYNGEGAVFNNWQLKNGKVIKGNFSMGKSDFILLEQENGNLLKVLKRLEIIIYQNLKRNFDRLR